MAGRYEEELGTYSQWAEAFSKQGLDKALRDQALLHRAQLRDGSDSARYTPSQGNQRACDKVRSERDDLDNREWNSDTGFSGVSRWPSAPGMLGRGQESDAQKKRRARKDLLDDGF